MDSVEESRKAVRRIVEKAKPTRYARGWHCLGPIDKYRDGKQHAINAFGQKLTILIGFDGTSDVHSLSSSWPTREQDGLFFVWNDPEGRPPGEDVVIPRIKGATSENWTKWVWNEIVVNTNARDVVEHLVDMPRFLDQSGDRPAFFKNVFESHIATQYFDGPLREHPAQRAATPDSSKMLWTNSIASYFGPSFMIDELDYVFDKFDLGAVIVYAHYPVDKDSLVLMSGAIVEKNTEMQDDPQDFAADQATQVLQGFERNSRIRENKPDVDVPFLREEDGPVYQLRRWYEQFFRDVDDIEPKMTDRFEYEVDTTMPMELWQRCMGRNASAHRTRAKELI